MQQAEVYIHHHADNRKWVEDQLRPYLQQAGFTLFPNPSEPVEMATAIHDSHHVIVILSPYLLAVLATLLIRAKNWVLNQTLGSVSRQLTANLGG